MTTRTFRLPGEIQFGKGVSHRVADEVIRLGGKRVLLVTDPGVIAAGIAGPVEIALLTAGVPVVVYSDVSPNPRDTEVQAAADLALLSNADIIVVVGGGSPIDLAKAVAGIATNGGKPQDWIAPRPFTKTPLPIIAIPTTAGTGSEVTRSSVINDTERQIKISLRDSQIAPKVALVDPELTYSLPSALTASTGMDALTHAIEAYTGRLATPITDALALQAMKMIAASLPKAVADGSNHDARETMMMASVIAGMAFSNSDVASVHCIAEAIGGRYDTPHGVANSLFLALSLRLQRGSRAGYATPRSQSRSEPPMPSQSTADAAMAGSRYLVELGRTSVFRLCSRSPGSRRTTSPGSLPPQQPISPTAATPATCAKTITSPSSSKHGPRNASPPVSEGC